MHPWGSPTRACFFFWLCFFEPGLRDGTRLGGTEAATPLLPLGEEKEGVLKKTGEKRNIFPLRVPCLEPYFGSICGVTSGWFFFIFGLLGHGRERMEGGLSWILERTGTTVMQMVTACLERNGKGGDWVRQWDETILLFFFLVHYLRKEYV